MKILVINWQDIKNPFAGGAEVYMHEVFGRIAAAGHQVWFLVCQAPGLPETEVIDGVQVIRHGSRNTFNYTVPGFYKKHLAKKGFDVVVEDLNKLPFYGKRFVKDTKLAALAMHFFRKTIFYELPLPLASYVFLAETSIRFAYKGVPFAVISKSTKQDLVRWGFPEADIRVIYSGVDTKTYFPGEKSPEPIVVYLGRIKKYKKPDLALRVVAEVAKDVPLRFHVVGDGEFLPKLRTIARQTGIEDITHFHGFVSQEEKSRLLRESWVLINTSPKEGWGLVNTEAEASGTPVVAFDAPGIRESISHGETGFLVPYGDLNALAKKLKLLLTDHDLRKKMSSRARKWAETFTWDKAAEDTINWLKWVMDKP